MSLAQTDFCRKHGYDPQSPLCAHIILAGTVTKVNGDPTGAEAGVRRASYYQQRRKRDFENNIKLIYA